MIYAEIMELLTIQYQKQDKIILGNVNIIYLTQLRRKYLV
jgi:hypothetical protein